MTRDTLPASLMVSRRRESIWCSHCHSSQRERRPDFRTPQLFLQQRHDVLGRHDFSGGKLEIAEINRFNSAHNFLAMLPGTGYVEYPEEDIQSLSFPDASFRRGHHVGHARTRRRSQAGPRERRCACFGAGGRHVFTVPLRRPDLSQYAAADRPTPCTPWPATRAPQTPPSATADMLVRTDFGRDFKSHRCRQAGSWLKSGAKASTPCSWPSVHSDR